MALFVRKRHEVRERKKVRDRSRERECCSRDREGERESQQELNHSAVTNANTEREGDGKLTGAFYIETK